jgi:hypothetical protein
MARVFAGGSSGYFVEARAAATWFGGGGVEGGLGMRLGDLRQRNSGPGRGSAKRQRGKARHVVTMQRGGGGIGARCGEVKLRGFYEVGSDGKELHSMSV